MGGNKRWAQNFIYNFLFKKNVLFLLKTRYMERTVLGLRNDIEELRSAGYLALFFYCSMIIMVSIPSNWFIITFLCFIVAGYVWFLLEFMTRMLWLRDTNGVRYFVNAFTKCYFEGSWLDKQNEKNTL